ncbi:hypothetical protein AF332_11740 [Sporosarcina globispora]|uniref:Uncharacterized protein n=1 Tax=Sporosarcina globispora TaxID=1459 RepID=A0A0M0GD22_SPOGL|nr:hypothetical protein [Sporosarcina globispora]KON87432.1 hypothetical protein AF332_11740 [Sporosarcina globispora]
MDQVLMWVDQESLKKFIRGEEFTAWSDQGSSELVQVSVPSKAIATFEEKSGSIQFNLFKKELW